jgi:hypothetical protein
MSYFIKSTTGGFKTKLDLKQLKLCAAPGNKTYFTLNQDATTI